MPRQCVSVCAGPVLGSVDRLEKQSGTYTFIIDLVPSSEIMQIIKDFITALSVSSLPCYVQQLPPVPTPATGCIKPVELLPSPLSLSLSLSVPSVHNFYRARVKTVI